MADYVSMMNQAAANNGISPDTMLRFMKVENPNFNVNARSYTGVRGLAQITGDTWKTIYPGVPYSTDPQMQLNGMAKLLSKYQDTYSGDLSLMALAYNSGPGVANHAKRLMDEGMSQTDAIQNAVVSQYPGNTKQQQEKLAYPGKVTGQSQASVQTYTSQNASPMLSVDNNDPATYVPVSGMTLSSDQIAAIMPTVNPQLIITDGLNVRAWNEDPNILQVNRPTSAVGSPVTFQLYFDIGNTLPVVVSLMASVRSHQRAMRHVITRQRTQTGLLVNLWGLAPDQITGQASTGMMANQLGVTDFLSLSTVTPEVQRMVNEGYKVLQQQAISDQAAIAIEPIANLEKESCRVAAKDAFVEFLSLFKNNGTVWFRNADYTGTTSGMEQQDVDVWSPVTGTTTFQSAAKRNGVMTRGHVAMNFRNSTYFGYFKSLNWTLDAKNPYRWNFTFVFQVESTLTNVLVPTA